MPQQRSPWRPSRRALLWLAGSAPAHLRAAGPRIIDTHTHFYDPARAGGVPWPPKSDALLYRRVLPADFRKAVEGLGVAGTVVVEASPLVEDNQWILDLARENPIVVGFIGRLDPGAAEFPSLLDRFARNPLFRGIRLNGKAIAEGLRDRRFVAGLERLGERRMTLDAIGAASMFADLETIARRAPGLKIVIDHLPFPSQPGLPRAANIYAKVSGAGPGTPAAALDELWDAFGPDRLVYGSNWPVSERVAPYRDILARVAGYFAAKEPDAAVKYFFENSRAAYGWVERT